MNFEKAMRAGFWMTVGSIFSIVLFYFRFSNELLRRELILFMQEGDLSYWTMFLWLDFFVLSFFASYLIYNYVTKRGTRNEQLRRSC